jgi:hypothetical protein
MALPRPQIMKWGSSSVSDHGRAELDITLEPIETSNRMVNGRLRRYTVAAKRTISTSWDMLPATAAAPSGGIGTVDGGMGAKEMKAFYDSNKGKIAVTIYDGAGVTTAIDMMITDFSMTAQKRSIQDFWSVSVTLQEV